MIKFINGLSSNSSSKTDILIATELNTEYIVKLYIESYNNVKLSDSVLYDHEIQIYKYLTDNLVNNINIQNRNILPIHNVIRMNFNDYYQQLKKDFVDTNIINELLLKRNVIINILFMLNYIEKRININNQYKLNDNKIKNINVNKFPKIERNGKIINLKNIELVGLITPKIKSLTFIEYLMKENIKIKELYDYIFLILTTLYSMSNLGINQNDLHWKNILMSDTVLDKNKSKNYLLLFDEYIIPIQLKYNPLIYDFDRAIEKQKYMKELNDYKRGGNCPTFNRKRDLLKTICHLYHYLKYREKNREANNLLNKLIISEELKTVIKYTKINCWLTTRNGENSYLCRQNLENEIIDWEECLSYIFKKTNLYKNAIKYKDLINNQGKSIIDIIIDLIYNRKNKERNLCNLVTNNINIKEYLDNNLTSIYKLGMKTEYREKVKKLIMEKCNQ